MTQSIIVAMTADRVIGRAGALPWRLSRDLRRFKRITMGHHIIMGRKTFDSIGRLLPRRRTIVVTRQPDFTFPGATVVHSVPEAVECCRDDPEAFIVGGAQIYREALPLVDRIYLTLVAATIEGDAFFPEFRLGHWKIVADEHHEADERNEFGHFFQILERSTQGENDDGKGR